MNKRELRQVVAGQLRIQQEVLDQWQGARMLGRLEGAVQALEMVLGQMDAPASPPDPLSPGGEGEAGEEESDG